MAFVQIDKEKIERKIRHLEKRKRQWQSRHNKNDTVKTDLILDQIQDEIENYKKFLKDLIE